MSMEVVREKWRNMGKIFLYHFNSLQDQGLDPDWYYFTVGQYFGSQASIMSSTVAKGKGNESFEQSVLKDIKYVAKGISSLVCINEKKGHIQINY